VNSGVNLILALAGSLCATSSLAAGEALRKDDEPFLKRVTSRMLLSLAFLGSAVAGSALAWLRAPEGSPPGSWLSVALLAAGAGATLWAYAGGPRRRGNESLGERLTPRGKLALGLLTAAQVVDLLSGQLPATIRQFQTPAGVSTSILTVLGLVLASLGTGAAAATFRSGNPLAAGPGSLLQRLSPLARGTLTLLGLALGLVGLATLLSSEVGMLLCLVLLALGITTGLLALAFAPEPGAPDAPGPWGISSRGWVSLAFLALAGGVLGAQQARLLGPLGVTTAAANRSGTSPREPVAPVGDEPSVWSMRKYDPAPPGSTDPGSERARLERELFETRRRLAALESGTRADRESGTSPARPPENGAPAPSSSTVDVSKWHHPAP
jgi:hypothetical protein